MVEILDAIDSVLYYPILLVVMAAAGLYFSLRMGFVQIHRLPEGMRLVMAKPTDEKGTSPFQALMVSSAACVGTGKIPMGQAMADRLITSKMPSTTRPLPRLLLSFCF